MTPAAFARDVAARCARIVEALAYGQTDFAIDAVSDLEDDARRLAEAFDAEQPEDEEPLAA
jgi:hypothetical protein